MPGAGIAVMKPRSRPSRLGFPGLQRLAQEPPGAVEDGLPGAGGHDRRLARTAPGRQRGQPVALALPLVGDELVHVPGRQCPRVMAAGGSAELQEGAQLQAGPPHVVEGPAAARAGRGPQHAGEVVPEQVPQPPLGHAGQVDADGVAGDLPSEVLGEDVAGLAGLLRCHVDRLQAAGDGVGDEDALPPNCLAQARIIVAQAGEGAQPVRAAVVRQALQRGQLPPPVLPPGVPGHAPLDLGPQERVQAAEVDLRRPHHRRGRRAPPAEGRLVGVLNGHGAAGALVAVAPLRWQDRPAGASL